MDLDQDVQEDMADGGDGPPSMPPQINDRVRCRFGLATELYDGTVLGLPTPDTIFVKFDDRKRIEIDLKKEHWGVILSRPRRINTRASRRRRMRSGAAARPAPEHGVSLQGRVVRKKVQGNWVEGCVRKFKPRYGMYEIVYPHDSDEEEMTFEEVVDGLVPDDLLPTDEASEGVAADQEEMYGDSDDDSIRAVREREPEPYHHSDSDSTGDELHQDRAPMTVRRLHALEVRKLAQRDRNLKCPMHRDIQRSGVRVPYVVPAYRRRSDAFAILDWQAEQDDEGEFADVNALTDANCRLDMAHFVANNQISHGQYAALIKFITKWLPAAKVFPPTADDEPHGKKHKYAFLLRLVSARVNLERGLDRKIQERRQVTWMIGDL